MQRVGLASHTLKPWVPRRVIAVNTLWGTTSGSTGAQQWLCSGRLRKRSDVRLPDVGGRARRSNRRSASTRKRSVAGSASQGSGDEGAKPRRFYVGWARARRASPKTPSWPQSMYHPEQEVSVHWEAPPEHPVRSPSQLTVEVQLGDWKRHARAHLAPLIAKPSCQPRDPENRV